MILIRKAHKWIALLLGIQLALWMLSGLGMALLPHDKVAGAHRQSAPEDPLPLAGLAPDPVAMPTLPQGTDVRQITLQPLHGMLVYRIETEDGVILSDAVTGAPIGIGEDLAIAIAKSDYSGPGTVKKAEYLSESTLETRNHSDPTWRIDFSDAEATAIYVSAATGEILERRNNYWRAFDVFWMLHIMDYQNRTDFNHPLIVIAALIVLWLGVSGIALWWDSFRTRDFNLTRRWLHRNHNIPLSLVDSEGTALKKVETRPLRSLFSTMEDLGYPLPSTCGGGGTCGLCRVKVSSDWPIVPADRRQIPETELEAGYRLACQHTIEAPVTVTLPHGLLDAADLDGRVVSATFLTPDMYELRLVLPSPLDFRAGSYLQVEVPPFQSHLDKLPLPPTTKSQWETSGTDRTFGTDQNVYRTYSLANAPGEFGNEIILNIRLALAKPDKAGVPVGLGSAYLTSLNRGDKVRLRGPFGDFRVDEEAEELVFIAGGAGIAPIRSMIIDQLRRKKTSRPISFWYGVRTPDHVVYEEDFKSLGDLHQNFSWHVAISDLSEHLDWTGQRGMIHETLRDQFLARHPDLGSCSFYICGPPAMLTATLELLESFEVSKDRIAFDDFGS